MPTLPDSVLLLAVSKTKPAEDIAKLPNLKLRGVMAIPAPQQDFERQRQPYRILHQAVAQLGQAGLDTFSFGMTDDLTAAIAEGSTIVRIGTALFGERGRAH